MFRNIKEGLINSQQNTSNDTKETKKHSVQWMHKQNKSYRDISGVSFLFSKINRRVQVHPQLTKILDGKYDRLSLILL